MRMRMDIEIDLRDRELNLFCPPSAKTRTAVGQYLKRVIMIEINSNQKMQRKKKMYSRFYRNGESSLASKSAVAGRGPGARRPDVLLSSSGSATGGCRRVATPKRHHNFPD
ncbi:hypothetical protein EVAR_57171_1 [Eumeta japonica]|uniref:Uncharacterized protein n=1 Tax=Eumeta variegata TaxID=151549 RepID=A0A4C1ZYI0_EUMVA|nr:hypothetical protein EVAR_57171_1 [Eumeta japonica]